MTRHIHADLMIQAANDTTIQWQWRHTNSQWHDCKGRLLWEVIFEYRKRPEPHPHQALMDIAAADPSIEWQHRLMQNVVEYAWYDCLLSGGPLWLLDREYRQKPAAPVMVDLWQWAMMLPYTKKIVASSFHATEDDVYTEYDRAAPILCRIEGSKITVPEVSQ